MSGYIGPIPVPQGIQEKETFTATSGQTTFNTNGYTDGAFINVFLNGVRLVNGTDYTATNGSDVVLASGANAGDVLDFETFNSFSLVNQTFTGDVTVGDDLLLNSDSAVLSIGADADLKITHDGTNGDFESAGDLTFDVAGDIVLDADGAQIRFKDAGTEIGVISNSSNDLQIVSSVSDADMIFRGNDGGTPFNALTLDMSAAGAATFTGTLKTSQSSVVTASTDADDFVIEKTGDTGLSILSTTTGRIYFGDAANDDAGSIRYVHSDNSMRFETDDAERMRILEGGGITFNGDTAAANALDDYEEGTWSTTANTANVTSITYEKQTYTKIGRKVFIQVKITATVTAADTRTYFSFVMPFSTPNNDDIFTGGGMSEASSSPYSDIAVAAGDSSQSSANTMYWAFIPVQTGVHKFYLHGQFETDT